jgi:XTP/dITP diphosphohydrolase
VNSLKPQLTSSKHMKIVAATNNAHKLVELKAILSKLGIEVLSAADVGGIPDVVEDKDTFAGNASKKAMESAAHLGMPVLSDDSGLCVEALEGRPGVFSARYGGPGLDDKGRCQKLMKELKHCDNRRAYFACVIALADQNGQLIGSSMGKCLGRISDEMKGAEGFGYDPLFIPNDHKKSFAELGEEIKNSLSHRKNALEKAIADGLFDQLKECSTS